MPFETVYADEQGEMAAAREAGRAAGRAARQKERSQQQGRMQLQTGEQMFAREMDDRRTKRELSLQAYKQAHGSLRDDQKDQDAYDFANLLTNPDFVTRATGLNETNDPGSRKRTAIQSAADAAVKSGRKASRIMLPALTDLVKRGLTGDMTETQKAAEQQKKIEDTVARQDKILADKEARDTAEKQQTRADKLVDLSARFAESMGKHKEYANKKADELKVAQTDVEEWDAFVQAHDYLPDTMEDPKKALDPQTGKVRMVPTIFSAPHPVDGKDRSWTKPQMYTEQKLAQKKAEQSETELKQANDDLAEIRTAHQAAIGARKPAGTAQATSAPVAPAQGAQPGPATTQPAGTAPVKVQSVEEALKYPSGTQIETPDGRIMVRP